MAYSYKNSETVSNQHVLFEKKITIEMLKLNFNYKMDSKQHQMTRHRVSQTV